MLNLSGMTASMVRNSTRPRIRHSAIAAIAGLLGLLACLSDRTCNAVVAGIVGISQGRTEGTAKRCNDASAHGLKLDIVRKKHDQAASFDSVPADLACALVGMSGIGTRLFIRRRRKDRQRRITEEERERQSFITHFEAISHHAEDAVILLDQGRRIVGCNNQASVLLGYSRDELACLNADDYRPSSQDERRQREIALAELRHIRTETRLVRKDGTALHAEVDDSLISIGGQIFHQSIIKEFSRRTRPGNGLKQSNHRFHELADSLPQAIMEVNETGIITYANLSACSLLGISDEHCLIGTKAFDLVCDGNREVAVGHFTDLLQGLPMPRYDLELRRADGTTFQAQVFASAIMNEETAIGIRAVVIDVTSIKDAEAAARESEHRFRSVTEATASAIFIQQDGRFVYVNPECCRLTGYSEEELYAMDVWQLVHPDHRDRIRTISAGRLSGNPAPARYEYKIVIRSGEERWIDMIGSRVEMNGSFASMGTVIDVTEKKRAEERLGRLVNTFLDFTDNPLANINRLLALCGVSTRATAAFYNILSNGTITSIGSWNEPPEYVFEDDSQGHICTEVFLAGSSEPVIIRDLPSTPFALSDRNVMCLGLRTYIGIVVRANGKPNGVLSMVFTDDFEPARDDLDLLNVVAVAIGIEEKRGHAEAALRQSDDRYRAFINATNDLVLLKDDQLRYMICNESTAQFFERDIRDIIGKTDRELLSPDIAARFQERDKELLDQGTTTVAVESIGDRLFEATLFPVGLGDNRTGIGAIIRDITENMLADARLHESQWVLSNLMNNLQGMTYRRLDDDFLTTLFVSEGCRQLTGYEPSELVDNAKVSFSEITYADDLANVRMAINRAAEEHRPYQLSYRLITKSGDVCWVWEKGMPIYGPQGAFLYTEGLIADITAQRLAEEALVEISETLQKVIASSPAAIVVINKDRNVTLWNPAAERIFGWSTVEALGKKTHDMPPEIHQESHEMLDAVFNGEVVSNVEAQRLRRDGIPLDVQISSAPLFDSEGGITSVMILYADISERKRADRELLVSAKGYERLFNSIEDAIYIIDELGCFIDVNAGAMRQDGYPREYYLHRSIAAFTAEGHNEIDVMLCMIKEAFRGTTRRFEWWSHSSDGRVLSKDVQLTAGFYRGQPAVIAIARDVSEQKQAELLQNAIYQVSEAVHAAHSIEQLFRSVHESIGRVMDARNFYIALYDPQKDMLVFPYHVDQEDNGAPIMHPGKSLTSYVLRTGRSLLCTEELFRTLAEAGEVELIGEWSPIWLGVPLKVEGQTIGVMVVQHYSEADAYSERDLRLLEYVSSQIAEAILKKRAEERMTMLAQAIMNTSECVCITDLDDNLIFVNDAFCATYGFAESELLGRPITMVRPELLPGGSSPDIVSATLDGGWRGELINRRKDGTDFPIILSTSTVRDAAGHPIAMIGIAKDITEWKRQQNELIMAKEQAEQSDRLKDTFIANMSHEIRTPLNIIMGYSTLFASEFQDRMRPEENEFFQSIERAGTRLMRTMELILNISSIQTGAFRDKPESIDITSHVRTLMGEYHPMAADKQLTLEFDAATPSIHVLVDAFALDQVISNIVDNAIKFTHQGRVLVRVYCENQRGCISVEDTGIGISAGYLPRIFKSFSQEAAGYSRSYDGLGLGLALTKAYVDRNHGTISINSTQGVGTKVIVSFPLFDSTEADKHTNGERVRNRDTAEDALTLPAILVVEDDPETQSYMRHLLAKKFRVHVTGSTDDALHILESERIEAVLMDLSLTGNMDGLALTRIIRKKHARQRLPIIAISGYAFPRDKELSMEAGCDAFLSKPFQTTQLFNLLDSLVAMGR
jgi:PAS domain S-box-containing protein